MSEPIDTIYITRVTAELRERLCDFLATDYAEDWQRERAYQSIRGVIGTALAVAQSINETKQ